MIRVLSILGFAFTAACAAAQPAGETDPPDLEPAHRLGTGLDVNDVSVLFPLPESVGERGKLLGGTTGLHDGTQLWPAPLFEGALEMASGVTLELQSGSSRIEFPEPLRSRDAWRIVSFRFDLDAHLSDSDAAQVQIRLVAQPITAPDPPFKPTIDADFAAHLVYVFPEKGSGERLARELLALSGGETTGNPLGVHPVLQAQGLDGPKAEEFRAFLKRNLSGKRLRLLAIMGLAPPPEPWVFVAGQVHPDGSVSVAPQSFGAETHGGQALNFLTGGSAEPPFPGTSTAALVSTSVTKRWLTATGSQPAGTLGTPAPSRKPLESPTRIDRLLGRAGLPIGRISLKSPKSPETRGTSAIAERAIGATGYVSSRSGDPNTMGGSISLPGTGVDGGGELEAD